MKRTIINPFAIWDNIFDKKERMMLACLVIIGLALRLINALFTQLWRDEIYTFLNARNNSFFDLLLQQHSDPVHPPLYSIFLHFWQKIAYTPFFLRLPSLIATLFILILIPVLAKKIYPNLKLFPVLALFFFSFSHSQISLNMVVRVYSFVILLMIISMIIFIDIVNANKISSLKILSFSLINFISFLTDYSAIWLILSYWVFLAIYTVMFPHQKIDTKQKLFNGLMIIAILILLFVPFLLKGVPQAAHMVKGSMEDKLKTSNQFQVALGELSFFTGVTESDLLTSYRILDWMSWRKILISIALVGLIMGFLKNRVNGLFLYIVLLSPLVASFVFSLIFLPIFLGRNLHIVNLVFILGLSLFFATFFQKRIIYLSVLLFFWVINFFQAFPMLHYVEPPYDWMKLHKTIYSYPISKTKYLITSFPSYMFKHFDYYSLFWPIENLKIIQLDEIASIKKDNGIVFLVYFLREKKWDVNINPYRYKLSKSFQCNPSKIDIDYIYFAECK